MLLSSSAKPDLFNKSIEMFPNNFLDDFQLDNRAAIKIILYISRSWG
jgi:hypothetical protein